MKKWLVILAVLLLGTTNVFSQEQTKTLYDVYLEKGIDAYENSDYTSAIKWWKEASKYAKKLGDTEYYSISLYNIATCYLDLSDYSNALEHYNQIIKIYRDFGDCNNIFYYNYAICLYYLGHYRDAIKYYRQYLNSVNQALGRYSNDYATGLNDLAACYFSIGQYSQSIELYNEVISIQKTVLGDEHPLLAKSYSNLAHIFYELKDYYSSIELNKQALLICEDDWSEQGRYLIGIAKCYKAIGHYANSIEYYKQAIKLRNKSFLTDDDYIEVLNGLSSCLRKLGDSQSAITLYIRALDLTKNNYSNISDNYLSILNNLALCYSDLGDYESSLDLLLTSLDTYNNIPTSNNKKLSTILSNIALCHYHLGNYHKSIVYCKDAQSKNRYNFASLTNLGNTYARLGEHRKTVKYFTKSIKLHSKQNGNLHIENTIPMIGILPSFIDRDKYQKGLLIRENIYSILKYNTLKQFAQMTANMRKVFWQSHLTLGLTACNSIPIEHVRHNNRSICLSYNLMLFSKEMILATDIEFDKVIRESGDTVLLEKFEKLRTTRAILNTYYNKPIAERPEGEVERLEVRAEVLEKDLLAGSKEYADFTRRLEIEWQDVQAALGDKDVAIEILAADEHIDEDTPPYYAALVLRKGWDAPKFVELCGAEELQAYFDSENGLAMMYCEANSRKLYDLIWGKLAEHINEGDNVYFSPGGLLHQVNVELLQDADGRLANKKYNLHRVSSTRELCFEKPKIAHSEAVLYGGLMYDMDSAAMVAQSRAVRPGEEHYAMRGLQLDSLRGKLNYLSASKTEVEKISKQMNQHGIKTTLYVEQIGNEESFKALSGEKTPIIHLATHGFFFRNEEAKVKPFFRMMSMDQERPRPDNSLRRSGLAFAGAQKAWDGEEIPKGIDDGVMLAQEITSMDLAGTDLVVLSACETGLGEINSEGVFGLQRAFKKAGVQTLIMSLWKVHDEATALFMQTFYDNLLSGKSKRDSFAAAQMALRKHKQYGADPYYWAGFIMLD